MKTGYEVLTIDHPMLSEIKSKLNDAIILALASAKDSAIATIALKMDIEINDYMADLEDGEKYINPIAFNCTVSTKKKVYDRKGCTMHMLAERNEDGMFEVQTFDDQITMSELAADGFTKGDA